MASVQTLETWLVVAITADRYVAITWPMKAVQLCTAKRAAVQVAVIAFASAVFNIPHWLEFRSELGSRECRSIKITAMFSNEVYQITYWSVLTLLFRFGLPLGLLTYLTIQLIFSVRSAARTRAELTHKSRKRSSERQITYVLLSVVLLFVLCETIEFVMHILQTLRWTWSFYDEHENVELQTAFNTLGNFTLTLSASMNVVIYCIFAKKFRQHFFWIMMQCGARDRNEHGDSTPDAISTIQNTCQTSKM
ncbi:hypothetical protein CAPTEDRAFT_199572 [Capitella teleta]|uniref:G-protein coupled receptors family 1 profile domain-containing protein n=1 Tax=Capitella teleta TaxID=283909 RepID=R7VM01_CAPTE|nr:hypothetical protein CAPTEDRAFT_199572 [Capitella teleta]|eukprot:ELU18080.1 hypothetical protein CAPTEDRAFT_199572 [Capitella teleta]